MPQDDPQRCTWAANDPLMASYHDTEWGIPQYDSRVLWEMLMLEGFQAGLSWITVLRKRETFREAFRGFHPAAVARFREKEIERLLQNPGIIRSRAKIEATIHGAKLYLEMEKAGEDFSTFAWSLAGGKPIRNRPSSMKHVPAKTALSEHISSTLKKRGFKFVGPTIVYAWMQAVGMVDDHLTTCFRCEK